MRPASLFSFLFPRQVTVTHRERLLSALGGFVAILLTGWVCRENLGLTLPGLFLVASMGASTVLLMAAPHSPFSQPWPIVGGHLVAATMGITCAALIPGDYLASALAVGLTIIFMFYLRCLHPPGGGTALLVVLGGPKVHELGYGFLLQPLLINLAILLAVALIINNLIPGRRYPHNLSLPGKGTAAAKSPVKLSFNQEDLAAALKEMGGYIDVTGEDLNQIYSLATLHAHQRGFGSLALKHIMTGDVVAVERATSLEQVWAHLRKHRIRGVPVVDAERKVIGMVSIADFLKQADWRLCDSLKKRFRMMLTRKTESSAQDIMSSPVYTVLEDTSMAEAFLTFAEHGINHLPVVDGDGRLVGIVTRLDLLAALYSDRKTA